MMRVLVVSNMRADPEHPERGCFVRDQVRALQKLDELDVQLYEFPPGKWQLLQAARDLRRRFSKERLDIVHSHFGLTAWPAMMVCCHARALTVHGTDVHHRLSSGVTRAALPFQDLVGVASRSLTERLPKRARKRAQVLSCGVDLERFRPLPRADARRRLGLAPDRPYVLFAADPDRPSKRYDRAQAIARSAQLLTLGGVQPNQVPLWINAANAVLVPSDYEGFGLAVLEALACEVPVLATPVGAHQQLLEGIEGTLCAPFERTRWQQELDAHLAAPDPRIVGRSRAAQLSTERMARGLADAWRTLLQRCG
jgi:teichuronic acid biosynthesis glycosyltransferase TuaC